MFFIFPGLLDVSHVVFGTRITRGYGTVETRAASNG